MSTLRNFKTSLQSQQLYGHQVCTCGDPKMVLLVNIYKQDHAPATSVIWFAHSMLDMRHKTHHYWQSSLIPLKRLLYDTHTKRIAAPQVSLSSTVNVGSA